MTTLDFEAINRACWEHIDELAREIDPGAKKEGSEWCINAHWRGERERNSLKANPSGRYIKDFASGEGYDPIKLWATHRAVSNGQAAAELAQRFSITQPIEAVPWNGPKPPSRHPKLGKHTGEWSYHNAQGEVIQIVRRYDPPGEKKQFRPLIFHDGKWTWNYLPAPRPLYGLDRLAQRPDDSVLVVEGEKTADAAQTLFPRLAVVTSGSSDSASTADWTPLCGRQVVLWPDNDEAGLKYAGAVHAQLRVLGVALRVVEVP